MLDTIITGAARALFVSWYADAVESEEIQGDAAGPGEDWMDVAPETPADAVAEARKLIDAIRAQNPPDLWHGVILRPEVQADPSGFGHYLAMEALGHGVAWSDSHPDHGLQVPYTEYWPAAGWEA